MYKKWYLTVHKHWMRWILKWFSHWLKKRIKIGIKTKILKFWFSLGLEEKHSVLEEISKLSMKILLDHNLINLCVKTSFFMSIPWIYKLLNFKFNIVFFIFIFHKFILKLKILFYLLYTFNLNSKYKFQYGTELWWEGELEYQFFQNLK